jgi:acetyl esterase/lipase
MPSIRSYLFRLIVKATSPLTTSSRSIPKLRANMEAVSGKPMLPRGVTITPVHMHGVPAEWIVPPNASLPSKSTILYLHGGAWTLGWNNTERRMAAYLSLAAHTRSLAVDYRLAPEYPFPAALEDCLTAYRWLLASGIPPNLIVIAGASAGANLTLATLMALRDAAEPLPAAAVCISAVTDLVCTGNSFSSKKDSLLTAQFLRTMIRHYIADLDPRLPLISPHYGRLNGLPPLLLHVGEDEILLSDSQRLSDSAKAAGVDVRLVIWPKMWHVWHTFVPLLPEAKQAVAEIGEFIQKHLAS